MYNNGFNEGELFSKEIIRKHSVVCICYTLMLIVACILIIRLFEKDLVKAGFDMPH